MRPLVFTIIAVSSLAPAQDGSAIDLKLPAIVQEPLTEAVQKKVYDMIVAVRKSGGKPDAEVTSMLADGLAAGSRFVRYKAAELAGECLDPAVVPALVGALAAQGSELDDRFVPLVYEDRTGRGKVVRVTAASSPMLSNCVPLTRVVIRSLAHYPGRDSQRALLRFCRERTPETTPGVVLRDVAAALCRFGTGAGVEAALRVLEFQEKWLTTPVDKRPFKMRPMSLGKPAIPGGGIRGGFADSPELTAAADFDAVVVALRRAFRGAGIDRLPKPGKNQAKKWRRALARYGKHFPTRPAIGPEIPVQAAPVRNWLRAAKTSDVGLLQLVFSSRMRARFAKEGWVETLAHYRELFAAGFRDYDPAALEYTFEGSATAGKVLVKRPPRRQAPPLRVVNQGGVWKVDER